MDQAEIAVRVIQVVPIITEFVVRILIWRVVLRNAMNGIPRRMDVARRSLNLPAAIPSAVMVVIFCIVTQRKQNFGVAQLKNDMREYFKLKTQNLKLGFTLVELLVVMAILGILTVVTLGNFQTSQIKARDAQRKHDLREITNALEAYFNDHGGYPEASGGKINACSCDDGPLPCTWDVDPGQREFCDKNNTVYMSKVPGDPSGDSTYCYNADSTGSYFQLYAKLENKNDSDAKLDVTCGGTPKYNFGISSSNCKPEETEPEEECK